MGDMEIKIISTPEALEQLRPFWEEVQWHPGADYEFFTMILRSRSEIISPCVLAGFEDGRPVALLAGRLEQTSMPVSLGYATLFRIPIRQVVWIEGGFMGRCAPEIWQQFAQCLHRVFAELAPDRVVFEQIQVGSVPLSFLHRTFSALRSSDLSSGIKHWRMRMPGNWEEFLKARSKKHRYWLKRLDGVLDRDFAGQWTIKKYVSEADVEAFASAAERVASKTYQRGLGVGFQLKDESIQRMRNEARRGQLRGYVLFIRDEPGAFWHCFEYHHTLYLASTGYDPAYRSYEIGTVLLLRAFRDHCGSGVEYVDFGLGDAGYKQRFGTDCYAEVSRCVFRRSPAGVILNLLQKCRVFTVELTKWLLTKLQLTQRLKTMWRRRIERRIDAGAVEPEAKGATAQTQSRPQPQPTEPVLSVPETRNET